MLSEVTKLTFTWKEDSADSSAPSAPQQADHTSFLFPPVHAPGPQSTKKQHPALNRRDDMFTSLVNGSAWHAYLPLQLCISLSKLFTPVIFFFNFSKQRTSAGWVTSVLPEPMAELNVIQRNSVWYLCLWWSSRCLKHIPFVPKDRLFMFCPL